MKLKKFRSQGNEEFQELYHVIKNTDISLRALL
jgi:hypothetical protein